METVPDSIIKDSSLANREYDSLVKCDFIHNVACFLCFEFGWGLGLPFAMYATMVPAYMTELKAPKSLIGIIASFVITMCPFQVVVSHALRSRARKTWLTLSYIACVTPWLLYSIFFLALPGLLPKGLQLGIFCFCIASLMAGCVGNSSVYFSLMTDCTPLKKRGSLYGYRVVALACGILLTAPLSQWVMKHWPESNNFLAAFILGNVFYMLAALSFLFVREHRPPTVVSKRKTSGETVSIIPFIKSILRKMLKNPNYRAFLFCIVLFFISQMIGSFIVVYAKEMLALKGSQILTFSIMQVTMGAVASILLGRLADRIGFKVIGTILGMLLTFGFLFFTVLCHLRIAGALAIYTGFFFYAAMVTASNMVMMNLATELLPKQNIATVIAVTNLIIMPAILIAIPLCGLIIDLSKGYLIVFVIGAATALISAIGFIVLVREPRKRRKYTIKYLRET